VVTEPGKKDKRTSSFERGEAWYNEVLFFVLPHSSGNEVDSGRMVSGGLMIV
jgi:hypothetical protein